MKNTALLVNLVAIVITFLFLSAIVLSGKFKVKDRAGSFLLTLVVDTVVFWIEIGRSGNPKKIQNIVGLTLLILAILYYVWSEIDKRTINLHLLKRKPNEG